MLDATDPVAVAADVLGAERLFTGRVVALSEEEHPGFYVTGVDIAGEGPDAGAAARLIVKNETMALFIEGGLVAMFPDRVLLLDPSTGRGLMSVELAVGVELVLLGAPAHPRLRAAATGSAQGRAAFSPARYGRPDLAYQHDRGAALREAAGSTGLIAHRRRGSTSLAVSRIMSSARSGRDRDQRDRVGARIAEAHEAGGHLVGLAGHGETRDPVLGHAVSHAVGSALRAATAARRRCPRHRSGR